MGLTSSQPWRGFARRVGDATAPASDGLAEDSSALVIASLAREGFRVMSYDFNLLTGPFRSTEAKENIRQQRQFPRRKPIDHECFRREMVDYFGRRLERLQIIKTTVTPRGQTI